MATPASTEPGRIITFYSYKGGTGRTMALANVACLLAETHGRPVLVVDWDLEAPGLHRFFPPRIRTTRPGVDIGLDSAPGLIDLLSYVRDTLPATLPASEEAADEAVDAALASVRFDDFIRETNVPNVFILRAGRNDDGLYSRRVGTFDWEGLFKRAPGVYRAFGEKLAERYRYVLIDSRTGVTDISGICTYLLPERLVVVFTPNRQSLTGVRELIERATSYRRGSDDLRPLLVFPLPSRIEASLQDLRARWRFGDPDRDVIGYQPMFQELFTAAYALARCDLSAYFDDVQIQQTPDYAYGEEIAVRRTGDRFSMANSYAVFVQRLTSGEPPWAARADPATSETVAVAAPAPAEATGDTTVAAAPTAPQVFLSHVPLDAVRIAEVSRRLARRGLRVASVTGSGDLGATFVEKVAKGLDASEAIVVFWSRESVDSPWVKAAAEEGLRRGILVPVLLDDVPPPLGFRSVSAADLSRGATPDALERLCEAVYRIAMGTPGTILAPAYAPTAGSVLAPAPQQAPRLGRLLKLAVAATVVLALVGLGSIGWYLRDTAADTEPPPSNTTPLPVETPKVTVPDFVGTSSGDVVKTADLIGLTVLMSDGQGAQAAFLDGVVTRQTPAPGTSVDRLSRIELEVETQAVSMPTLVGTTLNAALQALDRNRLRLGKTLSQPVADAKPGTIVQQTPEAGEMVAAGTAVDVVVATTPRPAPPRRTITVPNFVGATSAAAEAQARRLGITLSKVDADGKDGRALSGVVIAQVPAPNAQLAAQGTVRIRIATPGTVPPSPPPPSNAQPSTAQPNTAQQPGTGPPSTGPGPSRTVPGTVPQLIGLTLDAAREALARVDLRLDNAQRRTVPNATPGTVVAQAPSAGVRVRPGAGVTVVVAAAPAN